MKRTSILLIILLFASAIIKSQDLSDMMEKKGFIIISASKNYDAAKKTAKEASNKLGYKLDLRGLQFNSDIGLSFSKKECEEFGFEFTDNTSRGRCDDGEFVSVEYTNMYKGFTKGLYIVMVAHYHKGDPKLKTTLEHVKKYFKNAYIKYADVYMGCIH